MELAMTVRLSVTAALYANELWTSVLSDGVL